MANRYVVKAQSGYTVDGLYMRKGWGVWDNVKSAWINKHVLLDNSKGRKRANAICRDANEKNS